MVEERRRPPPLQFPADRSQPARRLENWRETRSRISERTAKVVLYVHDQGDDIAAKKIDGPDGAKVPLFLGVGNNPSGPFFSGDSSYFGGRLARTAGYVGNIMR
jgi:hypothetical protein